MDIAQWVGGGSFVLGLVCFCQKDDRKLRLMMLAFYGVHAVHFILLGSMAAAGAVVLSFVRTGLSILYPRKWLSWVVIGCLAGIGLLSWHSHWQLLAILGTAIGTYSVFNFQGIQLRLGLVVGASLWLSHNIAVGSIGGALLESCLIVLNLITAMRIYRDDKTEQSTIIDP